MACLASRVPYGTPLTLETLARIEAAEDLVRDCTRVQELRVRDHYPVARIEVHRGDIVGLAEPGVREQIVSGLKALGYRYITLDLGGLRSGSMNEAISGRELN